MDTLKPVLTQCWFGTMPKKIQALVEKAKVFAETNGIGYEMHLFDKVSDPIVESDNWRMTWLAYHDDAWYNDCDIEFLKFPCFSDTSKPYAVFEHDAPHCASLYTNGHVEYFQKLLEEKIIRNIQSVRSWQMKILRNKADDFNRIPDDHIKHLWNTTGKNL